MSFMSPVYFFLRISLPTEQSLKIFECIHCFLREMLERAFVKRLRDSDSDSEEESDSLPSKKSSEDKPTDILTTDKTSEVRVLTVSGVYCLSPAFSGLEFYYQMF